MCDRFASWLSRARQEAEAVYILGDLFDYWYTGLEDRYPSVMKALGSPKVHIMPGNRDFLLRDSRLQGIDVVHPEELVLTMGDKKVLIAHGHTLTEADAGFRLLHRYGWPLLRLIDARLPVNAKDRCARVLVKSSAVVRPSSATIRENIAAERGVDLVVCGHLHRRVEKDGLIVLGAFFDTGMWLVWDGSGPHLISPAPSEPGRAPR